MAGNPKHRRRMMAARMGAPLEGVATVREALEKKRETALSEGMGLVDAGHTFRFSASAAGLPVSTLHDNYQKLLGPDAPDREEKRRNSEARIEAGSSAVAEGMLASMARDIEVDATTPFLEPKDKAMYSQAATRSLERLRGRNNELGGNDAAPWADWLTRLQESGGGSIKVEVETGKTIDVTPSRDE